MNVVITSHYLCHCPSPHLRMFIVVSVKEVKHSDFLIQSSDSGKALQCHREVREDRTPC